MQLPKFKNEPFTNFKDAANAKKMSAALDQVRQELGREYPIIINGKRLKTGDKFTSYNPANKDQVIGVFEKATVDMANDAVRKAAETFKTWKNTPVETRAQVLVRTAEIIRERKFYFSAWMTYEAGKNWVEADGDTAEAIDFFEFYAREALRLRQPQPLTPLAGEKNSLRYIPLGVGAIIPPWNFPLAILGGMTTAAIVAGNTVVLKPSSDTPTVGFKFIEVLEEAGMPAGVVNYLPGSGASVGEALVKNPQTRFIAFTGSKEVGLGINELAAKAMPGQIWIKRVVAEMGGKDAIVVDEEADLDQAVEGAAAAAFGYQGQKCSACSRVIVSEKLYDSFLKKLKSRVAQIRVGPPEDPEVHMGPVINEKAKKSIMDYIAVGKKEGRVLTGGGEAEGNGYFIQPTVIADLSPQAQVFQEEIFGPVLSVVKASSYENALEMANDSVYGLTGAVYSKNQKKLDQAAEVFHVGNLYFNRKCTGALVGVHPFGGFNMSGTDSKAGGHDYLLLFTQAKTVSQKM